MFIVIASLALGILIVGGVFVLMFVDVAFGKPARVAGAPLANLRWHPPLVVGRRLLDWAADMAESSTAWALRGRRSPSVARELVNELHAGATVAIEQPRQKDSEQPSACPAYFHSMVGVTSPEAIRAAEYIREFHRDQVEQVREQALRNLNLTAGMNHSQYLAAGVRCPLMDRNNVCLAYAVRPLRCRGGCELSNERRCPRACATDPAVDGCESRTRGQLVIEGAERGFASALRAGGLDGELYELNEALVAALDTPQAAEQWIRGERVFATCRRYQ